MKIKELIKPILIIPLFLVLSINICGQSKIHTIVPGNRAVSGKFFKPYTNKWKVTLITPKGEKKFYQVWTDYLQKINLDGKIYIHRIQDIYDTTWNLLRTQMNLFDENTMEAVDASLVGKNGPNDFFKFNGKHVTGVYSNPKDKSKGLKFDKTFNRKVFDWSLYGILLAALPLKEDFHATLPIYDYPKPKDGWLNVDVNKKEMVKTLNGKEINTYKVETNQGMVFYISKEAPYVIKLVYKTQKGATLIWEMM